MKSNIDDYLMELDKFKLTYTVKKKSERLFKLKEKKKSIEIKHNWIMLVLGVIAVYIFIFVNRYASYFNGYFNGVIKQSILLKVDMFIMILLVVTFTIFTVIAKELKEAKEKYNNERKLLIDTMSTSDSEVCTCNNKCYHKDEYIKFMEEKGVDLF